MLSYLVGATRGAFSSPSPRCGELADPGGVTTYLVPPVTIAMSAVLLGELPPLVAVLGGAVCLVGAALSRRRSGPAQAV